ncbi:3-methyl-2-oxobutanoate hydroxymethyltransferase [Acinetobacter tandoii]|uniref:3-methyl-2-oxobutanoate hydroxymethyltransferase n=1 Tax=Acinetobacter tandoii TaxID=202954 RepID=UPI00054E1932
MQQSNLEFKQRSIYEQIVYHTTCVNKGNDHAFIIADMPFMSYSSPDYTFKNTFLLIQPSSHMVKIAGDLWLSEIMKQFIQNGIPIAIIILMTVNSLIYDFENLL